MTRCNSSSNQRLSSDSCLKLPSFTTVNLSSLNQNSYRGFTGLTHLATFTKFNIWDCDEDCTAHDIAAQLGWEKTTLDYFAFSKRGNLTDELIIEVLITDHQLFDSNIVDTSYLSSSIRILIAYLESGRVWPRANGVEMVTKGVICLDANCTNVAQKPTTTTQDISLTVSKSSKSDFLQSAVLVTIILMTVGLLL